MQFVTLLLATALFAGTSSHAEDFSIPGGLLISKEPDAILKPLLDSHSSSKSIRGLLEIRQSGCPAGWGPCSSGGCCPIGGQCCSNDKCCQAGAHCCLGGGCCLLGDNCVQIVSTGERGCCPIGKTCTSSGACATAGYVPCSNENFCCPPGDICYRDSSNVARCRSSSAPTSSVTRPATSSSLSIPTFIPTTFIPTTSAPISSSATHVVPTTYPSPFPSSGSSNVMVYASDTRINWVGAAWVSGASSCNTTTQSKKTTTAFSSFTFSVTSVNSIYLTATATNVEYEVVINGRSTLYTSTTTGAGSCKFIWSSGVITTGTVTTTVTVVVHGAPLRSGRRQVDPWSFEFHNFLTTGDNSASGTSGNPSTTTGLPTNSADKTSKTGQTVYVTAVATFAVLLSFFALY